MLQIPRRPGLLLVGTELTPSPLLFERHQIPFMACLLLLCDHMLLENIKVLEVGNFISAPFASKLLSDMGADVIKIETVGGDPLRGFEPSIDAQQKLSGLFVSLNSGKKLVRLNIESPLGRSIFLKLVSRSDILIENQGKTYWEKINLPWAEITRENRTIVLVSLTPYGNKGPYANYKGNDININSLSGIVDCIGYPRKKPINLPFHQAFFQQGLNGAAASLFSLLHAKRKKDEPVIVDISAFNVMASYVCTHNLIYSTRNIFMKREGKRAAGSAGAYPFTILQGKESPIVIMCPAVGDFKTLIEAMGNPEWSKDPRFQNPSEIARHYADEVDVYIQEWLSRLSDDDIEKISIRYGIGLCPVRNVDKIMLDEQYMFRNFFRDISYGDSSYKMPGLPFSCVDSDGPIEKESKKISKPEFAGFHSCSAVAERLFLHTGEDGKSESIADLSVGKDNDKILHELGYADSQIDEFKSHNMI